MVEYIEARGGHVLLNSPVRGIELNDDNTISHLVMDDGDVQYDEYVSAMPVDVFKKVVSHIGDSAIQRFSRSSTMPCLKCSRHTSSPSSHLLPLVTPLSPRPNSRHHKRHHRFLYSFLYRFLRVTNLNPSLTLTLY